LHGGKQLREERDDRLRGGLDEEAKIWSHGG